MNRILQEMLSVENTRSRYSDVLFYNINTPPWIFFLRFYFLEKGRYYNFVNTEIVRFVKSHHTKRINSSTHQSAFIVIVSIIMLV